MIYHVKSPKPDCRQWLIKLYVMNLSCILLFPKRWKKLNKIHFILILALTDISDLHRLNHKVNLASGLNLNHQTLFVIWSIVRVMSCCHVCFNWDTIWLALRLSLITLNTTNLRILDNRAHACVILVNFLFMIHSYCYVVWLMYQTNE